MYMQNPLISTAFRHLWWIPIFGEMLLESCAQRCNGKSIQPHAMRKGAKEKRVTSLSEGGAGAAACPCPMGCASGLTCHALACFERHAVTLLHAVNMLSKRRCSLQGGLC